MRILLGRPTTVGCFTYIIFMTPNSNLQDGHESPVINISEDLGPTIYSYAEIVETTHTFRPPSPKFYRYQKVRNLMCSGFKAEQHIRNLKLMIDFHFDISHIPSLAVTGVKNAIFGVNFALAAFSWFF